MHVLISVGQGRSQPAPTARLIPAGRLRTRPRRVSSAGLRVSDGRSSPASRTFSWPGSPALGSRLARRLVEAGLLPPREAGRRPSRYAAPLRPVRGSGGCALRSPIDTHREICCKSPIVRLFIQRAAFRCPRSRRRTRPLLHPPARTPSPPRLRLLICRLPKLVCSSLASPASACDPLHVAERPRVVRGRQDPLNTALQRHYCAARRKQRPCHGPDRVIAH